MSSNFYCNVRVEIIAEGPTTTDNHLHRDLRMIPITKSVPHASPWAAKQSYPQQQHPRHTQLQSPVRKFADRPNAADDVPAGTLMRLS